MRIVFRKAGRARFLSHLDLLATLEFAARRARLPMALSEGFNPRPRMSLAAPLPLGYAGERELLEIDLMRAEDSAALHHDLQSALPPGIDIVSVESMANHGKPAAARLAGAWYRVDLEMATSDLLQRVTELLEKPSLLIQETREKGTRQRDIRPFILSLEATSESSLRMQLELGEGGSARPDYILNALGVTAALITRECIVLRP